MGIKSILLSFTILLLGVLLFTNVVSAQDGYCSSTTQTDSQEFVYVIDYPSYKSSTKCLMNIGAEGAGVKSLQSALNHCYGQSLTVDGKYGSLTKAAVKIAQKKVGIAQDGVYGPVTGSKINWWAHVIAPYSGPSKCLKVYLKV